MGLYAVGMALAILLLAAGLLSRPVSLAWCLAGLVVAAAPVVVRVRYLVAVSDEDLRARSLAAEHRMKWNEIIRVAPARDNGYWAGRLFGPDVLEFASGSSRVRVNFKLFPIECLRDVMSHVPASAEVKM
jgi:hypothetical protein